jgi:hypothetical protein
VIIEIGFALLIAWARVVSICALVYWLLHRHRIGWAGVVIWLAALAAFLPVSVALGRP